MEEYSVTRKGTDDIYYVLRLTDHADGLVLLANIESGQLGLVTLQKFVEHFEYNGLIDDDDSDDSDDEPSSSEPQIQTF
ncbi:MAG: hypothetical protein ACMXYF_04290 [Candidatus Woesearchaeota archaeon]